MIVDGIIVTIILTDIIIIYYEYDYVGDYDD